MVFTRAHETFAVGLYFSFAFVFSLYYFAIVCYGRYDKRQVAMNNEK